jgi:hypothetical protein
LRRQLRAARYWPGRCATLVIFVCHGPAPVSPCHARRFHQ